MIIKLTFEEESFLNTFAKNHNFNSREEAIRYIIHEEIRREISRLLAKYPEMPSYSPNYIKTKWEPLRRI